MEQREVISQTEKTSVNFISFNMIVLFVFIIWWYNVISTFVFGNYSLSGEKQLFEIVVYNIGSFFLPLLYTIYILAHIQATKIKKQSLYFRLIGIAWLPSIILFLIIGYNLMTLDNQVYFE
ncbi:hypothetical protein ACFFLS_05020 [Flavobacterium procerum]|uniref:DUF4234 domain-containing protein n=1 Tax=Flavobacterium procerum TaxID=1455569 RepID=A0ABV6BLS4_9FLAO